jgi:hypothetical protein
MKEESKSEAVVPCAKLVQLLPADPGWHVRGHGENRKSRVACWALLDTGEVVPMIQDGDFASLAPAPQAIGAGYDLYTPAESYEYDVTVNSCQPPNGEDAEAIAISQSSDSDGAASFTVLWRFS